MIIAKKQLLLHALFKRKAAGVVDRAALEMRCTGNCTGGSNPSLSAEITAREAVFLVLDGFSLHQLTSNYIIHNQIVLDRVYNKRTPDFSGRE